MPDVQLMQGNSWLYHIPYPGLRTGHVEASRSFQTSSAQPARAPCSQLNDVEEQVFCVDLCEIPERPLGVTLHSASTSRVLGGHPRHGDLGLLIS